MARLHTIKQQTKSKEEAAETNRRKQTIQIVEWSKVVKDTVWVMENLLMQTECNHFLECAKESGVFQKKDVTDTQH